MEAEERHHSQAEPNDEGGDLKPVRGNGTSLFEGTPGAGGVQAAEEEEEDRTLQKSQLIVEDKQQRMKRDLIAKSSMMWVETRNLTESSMSDEMMISANGPSFGQCDDIVRRTLNS